ncbi:serine-type endopeptidase activity protein [[Candida] boidinii]|nr:serine-type endopeptidase activity protein [[Candida] boidinii]
MSSSSSSIHPSNLHKRNYETNSYFAIKFKSENSLNNFLNSHSNWNYHYKSNIANYHVLSLLNNDESIENLGNYNSDNYNLMKRSNNFVFDDLINNDVISIQALPKKILERRAPIRFENERDDDNNNNDNNKDKLVDSSQLKTKEAIDKLNINDPIFNEQWHLINSEFPGHDINVLPLWYHGYAGNNNTVVAIVDDGLDYESKDLKRNFYPEGSWDFNDKRPLPKPSLFDDYHGTRCAAVIAAEKGNGVCGVGAAYDSRVAGIRILSGEIDSELEANALTYALDKNDIYSCSWGPTDNGKKMEGPDKIVTEAIIKGVQEGRDSKGSLYVFASGNGGYHEDSCNYDGYTNSIYSITVSAIDHKGLHPPYAESCTAVLVTTYSAGSGDYIHTADFHDKCTDRFGGTSAAAPLAAGIFSMVLGINPDLSWRDVQHLAVLATVEINSDDPSWQNTAIEGIRYSPKFGYGKLDADKIVTMAKNFKTLKPQAWFHSPKKIEDKELDLKVDSKADSIVEVTEEMLNNVNLDHVEHVTVVVKIDSQIRGKVGVLLTSPTGIKSVLGVERKFDTSSSGYQDWTFMSVAHWGEKGIGNWTLEVVNLDDSNNNKIKLRHWQLRLWGESIDESKAKRYDLEQDYSYNKKDYSSDPSSSSSLPSSSIENESTSSIDSTTSSYTSLIESLSTSSTSSLLDKLPGNVNNNISTIATNIQTTSASTTASFIQSQSTASSTGTVDKGDGVYDNGSSHSYSYFPGYFLIFVVVGFVACLLILRNRKTPGKARRRDEYEFDIIQPEDELDSDMNSAFSLNDDSFMGTTTDHNNNSRNSNNDNPFIPPRNSLDASKYKKLQSEAKSQNYASRADEERERLFNNFNGIDDDHDEDEMFRITSNDENDMRSSPSDSAATNSDLASDNNNNDKKKTSTS